MQLARTFVFLFPMILGCSGAQVVLKSPIESQCGEAGLQGCAEITEGVLLFVEGKEDQGQEKLTKGAAQNAPEKVQKFAQGLRELKKIPGADSYMQPIMKVADILANAKGADAKGGDAKGGDAKGNMTK